MANLWNPLYLPYGSLTNWYDSTDTTTLTLSTGDTVANWRDKSYDANDLSETNFAELPLYGTTNINGLSTIDFDGGDRINLDDITISSPVSSTDLYIAYVGFNNTWTQTSTLFNFTNGDGVINVDDSMLLRTGSRTSTQLLIKKGGAVTINMSLNPVENDNQTVMYTIDCTNSSNVTLKQNYTYEATGARNIANNPDAFTRLTFGAQDMDPEKNGLNGQTGEFVVVQQADMSLEDKQKLEGYMAWKWGLQDDLPDGETPQTTHPYKDAPPTVTDVEFRNKLYETSTEEGSSRFRRLFALGYVG